MERVSVVDMKLRFTKKGIRLYVSRRRYLKVERCLLALLILIALIKLVLCGIDSIVTVFAKESTETISYNYVERDILVGKPNYVEVEKKEEKLDYRMTYYYTGDGTNSGATTASGKSTDMFSTNEFGWYTYEGKLVVATASKRLLSWERYKDSTQPTYNLYDELVLTINGKDYDAIVLDVCGACMKDKKIDLFVKDKNSGLDTNIKVELKK